MSNNEKLIKVLDDMIVKGIDTETIFYTIEQCITARVKSHVIEHETERIRRDYYADHARYQSTLRSQISDMVDDMKALVEKYDDGESMY